MELLDRKRRRLRRKYLRLSRHRRNAVRLDDWIDRETYWSLSPLVPWVVVMALWGPSTAATVLLIAGGTVAVPWFLFVNWQILVVAARKRDKAYRLVTRKHLSREYRQDSAKPPPYPPSAWDDLS